MATRKKLTPKKARAARGAVVKVRAVTEPPAPLRSVSSRQRRYQAAMAAVRKKGKGGGWHEIATFDSASGAAVVKRDMLRGDRLIDGKLSDWEIETRRLHNDVDAVIGSALYVRLK